MPIVLLEAEEGGKPFMGGDLRSGSLCSQTIYLEKLAEEKGLVLTFTPLFLTLKRTPASGVIFLRISVYSLAMVVRPDLLFEAMGVCLERTVYSVTFYLLTHFPPIIITYYIFHAEISNLVAQWKYIILLSFVLKIHPFLAAPARGSATEVSLATREAWL